MSYSVYIVSVNCLKWYQIWEKWIINVENEGCYALNCWRENNHWAPLNACAVVSCSSLFLSTSNPFLRWIMPPLKRLQAHKLVYIIRINERAAEACGKALWDGVVFVCELEGFVQLEMFSRALRTLWLRYRRKAALGTKHTPRLASALMTEAEKHSWISVRKKSVHWSHSKIWKPKLLLVTSEDYTRI